jgi:uncharacterized protein YqgC (DUF456 family)
MAWLLLLALLLIGVGAVCAHHIPGINVLVDGFPARPYTARTECDTSWLAELPAIEQEVGR